MSEEKTKAQKLRDFEYANIIAKLKSGKTLTARESAFAKEYLGEEDAKDKKETVESIAKRHGMTRAAMYHLKENGCDIYDDDDIQAYRNLQRLRVSRASKMAEELPVVDSLTIQQIEDLLTSPNSDYATIRSAKERLSSLHVAQKLRIALAESFSADEVRERDAGIAAAMKMAVMRFETDMPGQCEGLTAMQMKPLMRAFAVKILTDLADAQSPFWDKAEQAKAAAADMGDEQ
jgi:hypothetical protein